MTVIRRLPDELINKIAAGEVVERPASVIKELAENSVDAGASQVRVIVRGGGLEQVTVIDDGTGMGPEDAALALERHATSKLRDDEGLFQIVTKGFRGEALPSIASVSRFTLHTALAGAAVGTRITLEGGGAPTAGPAEPITGTRIDVEELFFNVPARRKFLKREQTERGHCEEAVLRLALAHPEVAFTLEQDGEVRFSSPQVGASPKERVVAVLGAEVAPHLLAVDERGLGVTVTGFVASPEYTLPTARGLYTFVNRRYVRDRGLNSAVQRAFQDALPPGRQPVTVLHLEVDPRAVDVNVHPQKLEVRFADAPSVQAAVSAAIRRALQAAPWRTASEASGSSGTAPEYALAVDRFLSRAQDGQPMTLPELAPVSDDAMRAPFGTARPDVDAAPPPGFFRSLTWIGALAQRYWVFEAPGGTLTLLDPRAVAARLAYAQARARLEQGGPSEPSLFHARLELNEAQAALAVARSGALRRLGIELDAFGGGSVLLRALPPELAGAGLVSFLPALVAALPEQADAPVVAFTAALEELAKAAARRPLSSPSHAEVRARLEALERLGPDAPPRAAKVVVYQLPLLALARFVD